MLYITVGLCVTTLLLCTIVKGYTTRKMGELKRQLSALNIEEARAREERGRLEIQLESAEARNNNVTFELEKGNEELEVLVGQVDQLETKLSRSSDDETE